VAFGANVFGFISSKWLVAKTVLLQWWREDRELKKVTKIF
jgi:hypothetical protein